MTVWNERWARWFGSLKSGDDQSGPRYWPGDSLLARYSVCVVSVALMLAVRQALDPVMADRHPFTLFFAAVAVTSWFAGFVPSLVAIALSYLAADWFFQPPRYALSNTLPDLIGLCGFLFSGLAIAFTSRALHAAWQHSETKQRELAREVAERTRIQEELLKARAELSEYADSLESKVEERTTDLQETIQSLEGVLYHVAHDLRAPLRAMQGFNTLLLEEYAPHFDTNGRDYAHRVVEASARMDRLIRDLLDYGHLGHVSLPLKRIDPGRLLDGVLKQLSDEITAKRAVVLVHRPLPPVLANETMLYQVLSHLLANALTYVVPGVAPHIEVTAETGGQRVWLRIQDNGIGIAREYHRKVFKVFERLQQTENYPGTGIGLAIVAKGAQRMKGSAGVESEPGKGSRFWVELIAA